MSSNELVASVLDFLIFMLPILAPILLLIILFKVWVAYAQARFLSKQEYVLLQIIPPRDVFKTPLAMELFINSLYQTFGEANFIQKYWDGSMRPWFSLEIASNGGDVGFYIWSRKGSAGYLQSQIYAQYPGIEVVEVEDYTNQVDFESGKYSLWGAEMELTAPDPVPIKTYIDYGLDKQGTEEEEKNDPITSTLEYLGSIRPGEFVWIQLIVKAHKKEDRNPSKLFGAQDNWIEEAKKEIQKIREESVVELKTGKDGDVQKVPLATKGQASKVEAIERSISKTPFDVGVRGIYISEKELFDGANIGGLLGSFKQYSSASLNGFKPGKTTGVKYPWQDPFGRKTKLMKKEIFEAYQKREYFLRLWLGKARKKMVLNGEEIATMFHFPGRVVQTPTLQRVQSKKSEAPSNLPIQ
jgi:hypothetical protein